MTVLTGQIAEQPMVPGSIQEAETLPHDDGCIKGIHSCVIIADVDLDLGRVSCGSRSAPTAG